MGNKLLISLTSIPRRLETSVVEVISAVKKQRRKCKIILNIPNEYKKFGKPDIPESLLNDSGIILWTPDKDYGPATKLLGALEYVAQNPEIKYILTLDDDVYYEDDKFVEYMLEYSKILPKFALTVGGIKLKHHPFRTGDGLQYNNKFCFVDVPAGYRGVLYPVEPLLKDNSIFTFFNKLPEGAFNDDDAYFGIFLNSINVPLYAIPKKQGIKLKVACDAGGSGVAENVKKKREDNQTELFQYAVNNKYLLNDNYSSIKKLSLLTYLKLLRLFMKHKIKYMLEMSSN